jgi:4-amino-4-deoxy-L-arabinose transferase-like glycosyltransferase
VGRTWWAIAAGVAVLALGLRVASIGFGLPAVYNPDEIAIVSRSLAFAKGDLNPHNFLYPTFYFYVLFGWIGLSFVLLWITGRVPSAAAFQDRFFVDPSGVYIAGRALGALCGTLTTGVTALLGRTLFDAPTGLVAAALLAVAPVAVMDAHYVKHDVPATLAVTVALWRLGRCWPDGGAVGGAWRRPLLTAAIACGVAWSTHYYTIFLALPLGITALELRRRDGAAAMAGALALAAAAGAITFFALSPFLLVEPATALRDIVANRQIVVDRATGSGGFSNLARYLSLLVGMGVTLPVAALAAIGTVVVSVAAPRRALLLLSFAVPFLLFIGNTVPASRYLNPILPVVVLMAAVALVRVAAILAPRRQAVALTILTALAAGSALAESLHVVRFFGQDDTRTLAARIVTSQVPDGATVLIQPQSVQVAQSRAGLQEALRARLGSLDNLPTRSRLRLAVSPWPQPSYRLLWLGDGGLDEDKLYVGYAELGPDPVATLRARGVQYVVLKRYNVADPSVTPLANALARGARRVASVSPYRDDDPHTLAAPPFLHNLDARIDRRLVRPGPIVDIFALE